MLGLGAGAIADRVDRRRMAMLANLLRAAVLMVLVAILVTGQVSIAAVLVVMLLLGTAEVLCDSATNTLLPSVVARKDLVTGNAAAAATTGSAIAEETPVTTTGATESQDLAPADTAGLDPALIVGIGTRLGGATSHTAIIARQLGIPCIVGLAEAGTVDAGTPVVGLVAAPALHRRWWAAQGTGAWTGRSLTSATSISVSTGEPTTASCSTSPAPAATARSDGGYDVRLDADAVRLGQRDAGQQGQPAPARGGDVGAQQHRDGEPRSRRGGPDAVEPAAARDLVLRDEDGALGRVLEARRGVEERVVAHHLRLRGCGPLLGELRAVLHSRHVASS